MFKIIPSTFSIGLESTKQGVKGAIFTVNGKSPSLVRLLTIDSSSEDVKPLYNHHPIISTALDGKEVLVRPLQMPVTKSKDIEEALAFQAEPLLPYPADQALLTYQILEKGQDSTELILLATKKETMQAHLEHWKELNIEPERVSCIQSALHLFGKAFFTNLSTYLIIHFQDNGMTGVFIKEGKLLASFALTEGLQALYAALEQEQLTDFPRHHADWQALLEKSGHLSHALSRLQKETIKMAFALTKNEGVEGVAITGEAATLEGLSPLLIAGLNYPLLNCEPQLNYSSSELLSYAISIGLALGALPGQPSEIDFRQGEWSYPHPWRRLLAPMATYFASIMLLCFAFYFFCQQYLHFQEDQLRQNYLELLGGMNRSHDQFERNYVAKVPYAHEAFNGEIPRIEQIRQDDLIDRLAFLNKELQASPDSFPLFANIPKVSDVIAWLTHHPAIAAVNEDGNPQTRLQIENFSYIMLKRPQNGKKQDKYQIKIELEFTSPTPKWAREFHDALIAPNDWVDPKGEVKWNTNRGKYKTSFFLKDRTIYPSL